MGRQHLVCMSWEEMSRMDIAGPPPHVLNIVNVAVK